MLLAARTPAGLTFFAPAEAPIATVVRRGQFGTGFIRIDRPLVVGLIPDGVASIDVTYPRFVGPGLRPYPSVLRFRVPVEANVVAYEVARTALDALPTRQV